MVITVSPSKPPPRLRNQECPVCKHNKAIALRDLSISSRGIAAVRTWFRCVECEHEYTDDYVIGPDYKEKHFE